MKFTPNPKFRPSTRPEEVFHHLEGTLLLDGQKKRLASISGKLTSEVKFGGGLLGYLERGGTFAVQQQEIASGYWEVTMMRVRMTGKALFLKTISVQDDETYTHFKPIANDTNIRKAVELLKTEGGIREASLR